MFQAIIISCSGQYPTLPVSGGSFQKSITTNSAQYPYTYSLYPPYYPYGNIPNAIPNTHPYGENVPNTIPYNYFYGQYGATFNPYMYPNMPTNSMNMQQPQSSYYVNPTNMQFPQTHPQTKSSLNNTPYQNNLFHQVPPPMSVYPLTSTNTLPATDSVNTPINNSTDNSTGAVTEANTQPVRTNNSVDQNSNFSIDTNVSTSNDFIIATKSPGQWNVPTNLVQPTIGSLFSTLPPKQPFYPPGYGPSNPFVLNSYNSVLNPINATSTGWQTWPMQQPFYPSNYPMHPYMYATNTPPNTQMGISNIGYTLQNSVPAPSMQMGIPNLGYTAQNSVPEDDSSSSTIINSNGETGSDVNSLPPQVKEFVDMIPHILSMPESQQFSETAGHSSLYGETVQPPSNNAIRKFKNSTLYKKKHYMPRRYYNHY